VRCESTVTIARAPADVFPWLIEPDKVPRWMSRLQAYAPREPGPLRVGSTIHQELLVGGRELRIELELTELDAPRRAVLRFEESGIRSVSEFDVTGADGRTRVNWVISGEPTSFKAKLIGPMIQAKLQEKNDADLATLRGLLEGG
jgi:carbon monoxide dehydrogenase subunit G